ncbi:MAG: hypothetical protein RSE46_17315 [Janthinobacterium sp.]
MTMQLTPSDAVIAAKPARAVKASRRKAPPPQGVLVVSLWPLRLVCRSPATPLKGRPPGKKSATA